ncbi:GrpB family protein [Streptomyces sp. OF3]|uniref:GrpB family protein n=1 Tax=Streptomyces alkaliterrae TaxID=2213162 RepID=A0A7W3ZQ66_9ACTN|nr:GrpB family protein [Streptomyces alkaliterrae]MBB1256376.1 GrpB family protein [Streptomyces alkaliterrae]
MSEAEIRAAHVDKLPRLDGRVELAEPEPEWATAYARTAEAVRRALGADVRLLEHVGSTSVPGLAAKPIIDILLELAEPGREETYVPALGAVGLRLAIREPEWYEHRVLRGSGDPAVNLHVFGEDCPESARMLRFRDLLRADPAARRVYERTKRQLAERSRQYVQNYADAKTAVIDELLGKAPPG